MQCKRLKERKKEREKKQVDSSVFLSYGTNHVRTANYSSDTTTFLRMFGVHYYHVHPKRTCFKKNTFFKFWKLITLFPLLTVHVTLIALLFFVFQDASILTLPASLGAYRSFIFTFICVLKVHLFCDGLSI